MLFISVRTAETHRARIVHKLGVKTRAEIVRYALELGRARQQAAAQARELDRRTRGETCRAR